MRVFCTYFDSRYLTRGLALWESLERHVREFELIILCLDERTHRVLTGLALPHATLVTLDELERFDPELAATKTTRELVEYYFTITPTLTRFVLAMRPDAELVSYIDADIYVFSALDPIWNELGSGSAGIIEHRFESHMSYMLDRGRFNVGLVVFRNDARGRAVLDWWRERCLEWCRDVVEPDRFGDQKYLDQWPSKFEGVVILQHPGANVAPWNARRYEFRECGEQICVGDEPLLFYHFQGLRRWSGSLWQLGLNYYGIRPSRVLLDRVYRHYIGALDRWSARIGADGRVLRGRPGWRDLVKAPLSLVRRELIFTRPVSFRR